VTAASIVAVRFEATQASSPRFAFAVDAIAIRAHTATLAGAVECAFTAAIRTAEAFLALANTPDLATGCDGALADTVTAAVAGAGEVLDVNGKLRERSGGVGFEIGGLGRRRGCGLRSSRGSGGDVGGIKELAEADAQRRDDRGTNAIDGVVVGRVLAHGEILAVGSTERLFAFAEVGSGASFALADTATIAVVRQASTLAAI